MGVLWMNPEMAGYLIQMLDSDDPRPAKEQFHQHYAHGGGWHPFEGFTLTLPEAGRATLQYPEDPPYREIARAWLREELILVFPHSWVCIVQPGGAHEICRMD